MATKLRVVWLAGVGLLAVIVGAALRELYFIVPGIALLAAAVGLHRFKAVALLLATLASWFLLLRTGPALFEPAPVWPEVAVALASLAVFVACVASVGAGTARSGGC